MKLAFILLAVVLGSSSSAATTRCPPRPIRLVGGGSLLSAGDRVQLRTAPPTDEFGGVRWQLLSGPGSVSPSGEYVAPFIVRTEEREVRIQIVCKDEAGRLDTLVVDSLGLRAGSFPGADSCRGVTQDHLPQFGEYVFTDDLPVAVTHPEPEYPRSARARGIEGSLVVNALVCRSGNVLDMHASWPVGATPDPKLERAALEAAAQWVFRPGMVAGQPVATWVAIPFRFKL